MTLSNPKVLSVLKRSFVCGWTDIKGKEKYAGKSGTHEVYYPAVTTTNCAGHHNVQIFFMDPQGRVLHCLPGYWEPKAFLQEARLATTLAKVLHHKRLSTAEKNERFLDLHLEHALKHDGKTYRDSKHQHFDAHSLRSKKNPDFLRKDGFVTGLKQPDQVMHERMAARPFLPYEQFDVASYVDMGLKSFDSHTDCGHNVKKIRPKTPGKTRIRAKTRTRTK